MTALLGAGAPTRYLVFIALVIGATAVGSVTMLHMGIGLPRNIINFAAVAAGSAGGLAILHLPPREFASNIPVGIAVALLASSLLFDGVEGVRRWVDVATLRLNIAAIILPCLLAGLARPGLSPFVSQAGGISVLIILLAQPDASQASAFGGAMLFIAATKWRENAKFLIPVIIFLVMLSWLRADPLQPVPDVELILTKAWAISVPLAITGWIALLCTAGAPFVLLRNKKNDAGTLLCIYLLICSLMPLIGAYPVPLIGFGMSFPIGCCLAMAIALRYETLNIAINTSRTD